MSQYFEFAEDASIQIDNVGQQWIVVLEASATCRCELGIEHDIRVSATRTVDHHFVWVDGVVLNAFEGALRGSEASARLLFTLMLQDEISSSWVDPCGPEHLISE